MLQSLQFIGLNIHHSSKLPMAIKPFLIGH